VFYGEFPHNLDIKNRIIIPSSFRQLLGDKFIITRYYDDCLVVFTMTEWDKFKVQFDGLPRAEEKLRNFMRTMFGGAVQCEPDANGRVLIPQNLREYAGINKEIMSVGVYDRIEIWGKERWTERFNPGIDAETASVMREFNI